MILFFPVIARMIKRRGIQAIALWPFIVSSRKLLNPVTINHERIHHRQQLELLIIGFYLWYGIEYLILRFKYKRHTAYRKISFEQEAYEMESDLDYLKKRPNYRFFKYCFS